MDEFTGLLGRLPWNQELVTFGTVSSPGFVCLILLFHLGMGGWHQRMLHVRKDQSLDVMDWEPVACGYLVEFKFEQVPSGGGWTSTSASGLMLTIDMHLWWSLMPAAPLVPAELWYICFRAVQRFFHKGKSSMECCVLLSSFFVKEKSPLSLLSVNHLWIQICSGLLRFWSVSFLKDISFGLWCLHRGQCYFLGFLFPMTFIFFLLFSYFRFMIGYMKM